MKKKSMDVSKEHNSRDTIGFRNLSKRNEIITLFTISKIEKQPECLSMEEWIKKTGPHIGCLPQPDSQVSLLKTTLTYASEYGEVELVLH